MNVYLTEDEQLEQVKKWLKAYGPSIAVGIIVAVVAGFGWRYWQRYKTEQALQASMQYENMMAGFAQKDAKGAGAAAASLVANYKRTPYAKLAGLMIAKQSVDSGNLTEATKQLQWVLDNAKSSAIEQIARLRLARVMIAQRRSKQALALLSKINNTAYIGLINEVKGDANLALGNATQAKQDYAQALKELPKTDKAYPLLEMKYHNVNLQPLQRKQ